ncbi:transcriptional regulator family: Fungal Specific TF [Penicillium roqueforti]|nr:transcriptional regulator family: Fungal Specific TF [Penicillium roqueforti]KAI3276980.1 transcriptional regulator family: Fungal Specific TF [Penicillium roqueforti]
MPGLDQVRRNSTISMARSMRVAKQERSTLVEREEKPRKQRKRALVACNRCRKRKIKCNGDLNNGLACSSCRSVGATECQYIRVNSLAPEDAAREAARFYGTKGGGRSILMGSPQIRVPYQREEYELDIHSNFSRQHVGMDHVYDNQSAHYHGQTSHGYIMPSVSGAMLDYGTAAWSNRAWDLNGRPNGEFFEEQSNHAAYGFVLSGQDISPDMPQSTGAMTVSYTDAVDRTLPTPPTCRSQPQLQPNINLSTLPDGLSGMTLASDVKSWNSRYAPSPDGRTVPMHTIPGNGVYNVNPPTRIKSSDSDAGTPDLFGYVPMSTADGHSPIPLAPCSMAPSAANPPYPALEMIEGTLVGEYNTSDPRMGRTFSRDSGLGRRLVVMNSNCSPDVYGYVGGDRRKSRVAETEVCCSGPTLVNGLPYNRVRHVDSTVGLPCDFLAEDLSDYGRSLDSLHRSPVPPLGHQGAY